LPDIKNSHLHVSHFAILKEKKKKKALTKEAFFVGVYVDIIPPSTVKVGKAQVVELAGMTNDLKRKLREITVEQLGQEPKLKKGRLQCALLLRGVQFNPKDNQEALKEQLLASSGVAAGRLDKVPKEIAAGPSIDASADPFEKFAQGLSKVHKDSARR
jgi:hypothetical protein